MKIMEGKKQDYRFEQGYLCAVCALINMNDRIDTDTYELFRALGGGYDLKLWRKWGIDESDIETLKKYRKQLYRE